MNNLISTSIMGKLELIWQLHTIITKKAMKKGFCIVALLFLSFAARSQSKDCGSIQRMYNKTTGRIIYRAQNGLSMGLMKIVNPTAHDTLYYACFYPKDRIVGARAGVTISLDNGQKVTYPEEQLSGTMVGDEPSSTTFVSLTPQDMKQLINTGVSSFRLSAYDETMTQEKRQTIKQQAYCLTYGTNRVP